MTDIIKSLYDTIMRFTVRKATRAVLNISSRKTSYRLNKAGRRTEQPPDVGSGGLNKESAAWLRFKYHWLWSQFASNYGMCRRKLHVRLRDEVRVRNWVNSGRAGCAKTSGVSEVVVDVLERRLGVVIRLPGFEFSWAALFVKICVTFVLMQEVLNSLAPKALAL